ncbi:helix-turn-helix transcriptional regulator [Pseudomonas citronellolis]|uniref:helix-turn-helix transcriptional regulator n=1 Tax=Pseudomonas citronellolis TaxID=53408 RepID=UPI0023E3DBC9|nr:helix-turn-helix transcriptional regulator [Pseudomonas citronellolis]MDF3935597.1 helix-turn-helix transcriptional regulator [Pseudomonas citronellolis]
MRQQDLEERYDHLIGLSYDCVLEPESWRPLLASLVEHSGRQQGALLFWDQSESGAHASEIHLCDPAAIAAYNREFCHIDPSRRFMLDRAVGDWYHDVRDFGLPHIGRDPFYQEFHRPNGMLHVSCLKLHEQATSGIYLSVLTSVGARFPNQGEQRLLQRLSPHLLRAARMFEQVNDLRAELAKRDLLLDRHPNPLWLLDVDGRVLYCNQAAQRCLARRDSPFLSRFGRLAARQQDVRLQALLRQAGGRSGRRRAGWLRLPGGDGAELLATPVAAEARFNQPFQKPLVLLTLLEQAAQGAMLADLFDFTAAEQRLATLLVQGLTPEQCASHAGVSINTVRSQLRALFRKTDTGRQAELVHLLARLAKP